MTITFPHPHIYRPDFKRYAVAGVAIVATAVAFTGILAVVNDEATTTSAPTTAAVSGLSTPAQTLVGPSSNSLGPISITGVGPGVAPDTFGEAVGVAATSPSIAAASSSEADRFAESLRALADLPQSIAPATASEAVRVDQAARMLADLPQSIAAATGTVVQSGGYATQAQFLEANSVSVGTVAATAAVDLSPLADWARANGLTGASPTSVGAAIVSTPAVPVPQTGGYATQAQFLEANVDSYAVSPAAARTDAGFDPYPEAPAADAIQPRSNFASDVEWLEANGWAD